MSEMETAEKTAAITSTATDVSTRPVRRPRLALSRKMRKPTEYVQLLNGGLSQWAFNEELAPQFKGAWREKAFSLQDPAHPLDLEIGTGNGYHFAHRAKASPDRALLGMELKFKPLIQTVKRTLAGGATNGRMFRYDASCLENVFALGELNNVYIHFPDPWPKERHWKHRLIQDVFLNTLYDLMQPGSFVEFKTDSLDYFEWAAERFHRSKFRVTRETRDLHRSEWASENFVTHFEGIFLSQGIKINYALLEKT